MATVLGPVLQYYGTNHA